jgi:hypothetical protein
MRKYISAVLGGALACFLLLPASVAWAQATAGTIKGEVVTTEDVPIAGATVRIESPSLMGIRQATSDDTGRFRFPNLPAGPYTLTCEKEGYKTIIRRGLVVETGRNITLKLVMDLPEMGETVEIIDRRPTVDTEQTDVGETLSHDFLGELPTGRSYQDVIQFLPGVTGGANPNVHGATSQSNQYYVDGVNTTDVVTNTFSMNFNFDAIQDIQVVTGAFDAKYGQALGGIISVTTKSGGNRFEGDFYAEYTTSALQSHDAFLAEDIQEVEALSLSAYLGGPIVKDHLWFAVAYQIDFQNSLNLPALDTGRDLSRYPVLPRKWRSHYLFGKLTWQISYVNKLAVSFATNPTSISNSEQSIWRLPEAETDWYQGGWFANAIWDWTPSAFTLFNLQAYFQKSYIRVSPAEWRDCEEWNDDNSCADSDMQRTPIWSSWAGGFSHGSDGTYYNDLRYNFTISADFDAYFDLLGTHNLGAGMDLMWMWTDYQFQYNANEVVWAMPSDQDGDGLWSEAELNDIDNYENVQRAVIINLDPYRQKGRKLGAYVQDIWHPWDNLTLRPGVRFDHGHLENDSGESVLEFYNFSPRLNFSWDPFNDRKSRVHGGYNKYIDSGYLQVAGFVNRNNLSAEYYNWDAANHRWNTDGSRASTPTPDLAHFDIVPANTDEFVIGFEREIQKDLAADITYIHRWYRNSFEDDEVNLIWDGDGTNVIGNRTGVDSQMYRMRTPADGYRNYYAWEFTVSKNLSDNLQLLGSYTYSRTEGNTAGLFSGDLDHPMQRWYENGILSIDRPHVVKFQGAYDNPSRFKVTEKFSIGYGFGFVYEFASGSPYNKYYYNNYYQGASDLRERRGISYRLPAYSTLDLRATIKFTIVATQIDLVVMADNILGSREITSVYTAATNSEGDVAVDENGDSYFARPYRRQFPRQVRFGLRVHF